MTKIAGGNIEVKDFRNFKRAILKGLEKAGVPAFGIEVCVGTEYHDKVHVRREYPGVKRRIEFSRRWADPAMMEKAKEGVDAILTRVIPSERSTGVV